MPVKKNNKDSGQYPNVPQFEKSVAVKGGDRKLPAKSPNPMRGKGK